MRKTITILLMLCASFGFLQAQPVTGAPTPPARSNLDVISIFSSAYTDVAATNFNPWWGQVTVMTTEDIAGNSTLKYAGLNYQGTVIGTGFDATSMEFVHLDMYTEDATIVKFFPINKDPNGEQPYTLPITLGAWVSYDIPLSTFTGLGMSINNIKELKFENFGGTPNPTIYIDNIYFYAAPPAATTDARLTDLKMDGTTITGFSATKLTYKVGLVEGTTTVPTITVTTSDASATAVVTPATSIPGTSTVVVTALDGTTTKTYSVAFAITTPAAAAATPPVRDAADVISIFSSAYTDIAATNYNPNWSQATVMTTVDIAGNSTLKYAGLNYQGTDIGTGFDATAMEFVHIDMWTNDATEIKFYPINKTPDNDTKFYSLPITLGAWVSYDIPMSEFLTAPALPINNIKQLKFVGTASVGNPTIFLDNIYFYKVPVVAGSDATLSDLKVDGTTITGFGSSIVNYKVGLVQGTTTVPSVTVTTNDPTATKVITAATAIPDTTTIVVTAQDGITTKTYKVAFAITSPSAAAPTPPVRAAGDVVSIFSSAYTDVAGINFNPGWGQSTTMTTVDIVGNSTLKYANMNYQGTVIGTGFDATSMEYVHIDMWTNDATEMKFFPINKTPDSEKSVSLPITLGQWRSYDIPMSDFTSQSMTITNIKELKFEGPGSPTIYLDNIYFYKVPSNDATLVGIKIGGTALATFTSGTLAYNVVLPYGTTAVPTVTATTADANAVKVITAATALPGTTSIAVTSQDGSSTKTYTVAFTVAAPRTDATLSNLKVNGTTISGFSASKLNYVLTLELTATVVPTVTCTTTDSTATKVITAATAIPGTTSIVVKAQDGTTTKTYTVAFTTSPTYEVNFTVVNPDQRPLADAQVVFMLDTLTTDINGMAEFGSVSPTTDLSYSVKKAGYYDVTGTLSVVDADVNKTIILEIKNYAVKFTVVDTLENLLADAEVFFMLDTLKTDINGVAEFTTVTPTTDISYIVKKEGYIDVEGTLSVVDADVAITVTLKMVEDVVIPDAIMSEKGLFGNVYPNPTNGALTVQLPSNESEASFELFDLNGKMVEKATLNKIETTIDLSKNKSGIYILKVVTGSNQFIEKIVIRK